MNFSNFSITEKQTLKDIASMAVIEHYRKHGFKDRESVKIFIKYGLKEPIISDQVICNNHDHISPFEFLSDVLLGLIHDYIVWANRSGSKTYLAGLISWVLSSFQDRRETKILGGSAEQSDKGYKAMNSFWDITHMRDRYLLKEPMITKTLWKNGSEVSILAASSKSVRGPHPQSLLLDEIDEMEVDIYEAALQQPQSKYGISASTGRLSTNHHYGGTMDKALESAANNPLLKIYKWCIWEVLESCKDYECSTCPLSSYCPGKQMKKANGYYKMEDLIKKLYDISFSTLQVEWFCTKIQRKDLVYSDEFDEEVHFINRPFSNMLPVFLSVDWGGVDPFSVGAWQSFADIGWVRVDEVYMPNSMNPSVIKECKKREWWNFIESGIADPSRVDLRAEWAAAGIKLSGADNKVEEGVEAYKAALKPVIGNPKIHFNRDKCRDSFREFNSYRVKNNKIVKKDDHTKDEERYFVMWKIKKGSMEMTITEPANDYLDGFGG
ncbi:hypothetical protein KAR91_76150 [Candidatus Pacearchaeota archaeon]|nr:hypothetical protein [Candidatus Pacearchaeota archaeon]